MAFERSQAPQDTIIQNFKNIKVIALFKSAYFGKLYKPREEIEIYIFKNDCC